MAAKKEKLGVVARLKTFWFGSKARRILIIAALILIQTIVYIVAGLGKSYLHMDEAYSFGLANYDQVEIQENEDFYNTWHDGAYYQDYLVVDADEQGDFSAVYDNQRDDVHPPLFYLLLRIGMEFSPGVVNWWTGIILNIIAFAVNTVFLYLVVEKLLYREKSREVKAGIVTLVASLTLAAISTVIYVRMYALLAMWVAITAYLHLRLLDAKQLNLKLLVAIGVVAVLGVLTQYYYLFFLAPLCLVIVINYWKGRRWRELWVYVGTLVAAGAITLMIWPHAIQHLFFGYRGQGAISNLLNATKLGTQIGIFFGILTLYDFHITLPFLLIAMLALAIRGLKKHRNLDISQQESSYFYLLFWPTIGYFTLAAIASPFTDLRYIEAICGVVFVLVSYGIYRLLELNFAEKISNRVMLIALAGMMILPLPFKIEPDVMYTRFAEVVQIAEEKADLPVLYIFDKDDNRFLDDITLFTKFRQSYIMLEQDYTEEDFEQALAGKDLSKGILVFANYGYENEKYLEILRAATGLENQEYLFRLNAADLYFVF